MVLLRLWESEQVLRKQWLRRRLYLGPCFLVAAMLQLGLAVNYYVKLTGTVVTSHQTLGEASTTIEVDQGSTTGLLVLALTLLLAYLFIILFCACLLYTSPSPRDKRQSRMPSSA